MFSSRSFRPTLRQVIASVLLIATFIGVPTTAWAATKATSVSHTWKVTSSTKGGLAYRIPSSSANDVEPSRSGTAQLTSDASGRSCTASYGYMFRRTIKNSPDPILYTMQSSRYCDGPTSKNISLSKGRQYHFDGMALQYPATPTTIKLGWKLK
ncbi:hypothetical protein SAMN04487766_10947 [Actinomyces ruminicola]|uniref:Uncharacterized protein n=1 Tax=Actinomyces ruminicola TaxID=332524 RepID=A0A1G9XAS1_9ACTO|nr:hypothetical protein SAMN04487766_10947 [Actinomyces ruminicola]